MVVLTSRVALLAASISLAAISNAPTAGGVAVPVMARSEAPAVEVRHTPPRKDNPVMELPEAAQKKSKGSKGFKAKSEGDDDKEEKGERKNGKKKGSKKEKGGKGENHRHHETRDTKVVHVLSEDGPDPLIRIELGNGEHVLHLKRSSEQRFFHDQTGKTYGKLVYNQANRDVDASTEGTDWDLVPQSCPQDCDFQRCVSFAIVDPQDIHRSRCITYTTSSTQPQTLHAYECFGKEGPMDQDGPSAHLSQIFGYEPSTGVVTAIPVREASSSGQPSPSGSVQRRQQGQEVTMVFHPLGKSSAPQESQVEPSGADPIASGPSSSSVSPVLTSSESTSTAISTATAAAATTDTANATAPVTDTAVPTTTMTVTVTASSDSATFSPSTTETTAYASSTANALKVEVYGSSSSTVSDSTSASSSAVSDTSAPSSDAAASPTSSAASTPTSSVNGDDIASSIAADYSSSYSSSSVASTTDVPITTTESAASSSSTGATRK
ncbi:hypothetical protein V5O48_011173 [Marasmius crinis-equi]|uniref:Apple domain-containing protein n=1 Tax=Marasmius crinis-equi TaxID=585013 RepID=A0ABR3F6U0_9AGAR